MQKKIVLYYSYSGHVDHLAKNIAKEVDADKLRLSVKGEKKGKKGFAMFFFCGMQIMFKSFARLMPFVFNPDDYDVIFIGTPTWGGNYTPALRTFFSKVQIKGKKIALFCTNAGTLGETFSNLKKELEGNEFLGEIDFKIALRDDLIEAKEKIVDWAKKIVK